MCVLQTGGLAGLAFPGHVHIPPVQPGPLGSGLQEDQRYSEHPGGEAETEGGAAAQPGGGAPESGETQHENRGEREQGWRRDGGFDISSGSE